MKMSFEETKRGAQEALGDMERELLIMRRAHRNYLRHNATNAAAEMADRIRDKELEIMSETELFNLAFY